MWYIIIVTVLAVGCGASPTAPSITRQPLQHPPELAPVMQHLDADPWVHPLLGATPGAYVRQHVREIRFDASVRQPYLARAYGDGTVGWTPEGQGAHYDSPSIALEAAYVLHEARHIAGHSHTCGDKDRTLEEGGAWAVHIAYLRHKGFTAEAQLVQDTFIGCEK